MAPPATTREFVAESARIVESASNQPRLDQKILALWRLEGLAFGFFERRDDRRDPVLDLGLLREAGPPVHCGIAMAEFVRGQGQGPALLSSPEETISVWPSPSS